MADQNSVPEGYDYEPEMTGGKYLTLKKKDDQVRIRIVSTPKHKAKHWITGDNGKRQPINCTEDESCPWCGKDVPSAEKVKKTESFAWVVIDRADGAVKMFTAPSLVYQKVKNIASEMDKVTGKPVWGDPQNYDLSIKRPEVPGNGYYDVMPIPSGMGAITDEEKALVAEANIDLAKELEGGKDTKTFGGKQADVPLETVGGDEDSGEVDPESEDIPF